MAGREMLFRLKELLLEKGQPEGKVRRLEMSAGALLMGHRDKRREADDELHGLLSSLLFATTVDAHATSYLTSATPYPSGVVGLHYTRQRGTM
jgi:hypothetical protein